MKNFSHNRHTDYLTSGTDPARRQTGILFRGIVSYFLIFSAYIAAPAASAAIAFVDRTTSSVNTAASLTINVPAGVVAGHVMLAQITVRGGTGQTIAVPAGWTAIPTSPLLNSGTTLAQAIYYRVATGAEPVSYTWTFTNSDRAAGGILAYSGVDTTAPINVSGGTVYVASTSTTVASVTTTVANTMLVGLFGRPHGNDTWVSEPPGTTLRYRAGSGAGPNGAEILASDEIRVAAGATGTRTATDSNTIVSIGHLVALTPGAAPLVNHYAISYPLGQPGVTCEAQAIRITAHADATDHTQLIAPSNTTKITLTTTPAANSWAFKASGAGAPGVFTNLGGGAAEYTFNGTEQFVEFWLTRTTVTTAPHIDIDVTDGTATDVDPGAEDARAEFADTAFRFFADNVAEGIGPQISGKSSTVAPGNQTLQLRAVQTSTTTGACQAALTAADTPVEMAFTCNNPTTCQTPLTITAAATQSIAGSPNAGPLAYTSVNMNFGGTGVAPFSFTYADAGQITLHARKVLTATDTTTPPTTSFTLLGSSNAIKVKPAGLCVQSADPNADCVSGDATCTAFKPAGDGVNPLSRFNLTVKAVTWESAADTDFCSGVAGTNLTTPNFQLNNIPLTHTRIAPAGGQDGNLAITTVDIAAADNGAATITSQAISEVGVFTITATPPLYLADQTIAASTSANIGRFTPHRFTVTDNSPALVNACTTGATPFTYMDQPFYYGTAPILTITALNTAGIETNNYDSGTAPAGFWKLTSALPRNYTDQAGAAAMFADVQDVDVTLNGHTDFDGIGTLALDSGTDGDSFNYMRVSEEAEFNADIDLLFTAAGLTDSDDVCYDVDDNGSCDTYEINGVNGALLRFGRLVIGTGFGSELLPVPVPMRTEYFDGTGFVVNMDDDCTELVLADHLRLNNPDTAGGAVQAGDASMTIDAGSTSITAFNSPLINGAAGTVFSAPGSTNVGFVNIEGNLDCLEPTIPCVGPNTFLHLLYDWADADGLGDGPYDDNPAGRVDFGVYEGPRTHIYTREPW